MFVGSSAIQYARRLTEQKRAGMTGAKQTSPWSKLFFPSALIVIASALWLLQPIIANYYNSRGNNAKKNGDLTQAIHKYQRAISLKPDRSEAHIGLAYVYEKIRDFDKAIVEYQTAIKSNNKDYQAYNNLASIFILHLKGVPSAEWRRP